MTMTTGRRPKAYSYVRFSTPEQAKGDSLRRQTELARDYAAKHGLDLDGELTFQDLGVSAFRGRNAQTGALGAFLEAVRNGTVIVGSYLIVEALDRVSRQTVRLAVRTMEDIVSAGINVVDLQDGGKVYNTETLDGDPMAFLIMGIRFMRAHEESARKSGLVSAAYEQKRKDAANTSVRKPFTRMLPAWLRWDDNLTKFVAIPERAKVLQRIFRKAHDGFGANTIARELNEDGIETWDGRKHKADYWQPRYVQKLLTNRAVLGTFTPHHALKDATGKRTRTPLKPIEKYWPAVVDRDVFDDVNARLKATAPRGRNADALPKSVFAGVLKCARCGATVTRVSKGEYVYLVCTNANIGVEGHPYHAVRYQAVEDALTTNVGAIVRDAPRGRNTEAIEKEIARLEQRAERLAEDAEDLAALAASEKSEAARRQLRAKEQEAEQARTSARELRNTRDTLASANVSRRLKVLKDTLTNGHLDVTLANRALKEAVRAVVIDPERGTLAIHWHHADKPTDGVPFHSRHNKAGRFGKIDAHDGFTFRVRKRK